MHRRSWWADVLIAIGIIVALWLSPMVLCVVQMAYEMPANSIRLWFFGQALFEHPLPPQTEELERNSEVGLLVGNSNHCDYLAERVLATRLSRDQIESHFKGLDVAIVFGSDLMTDGRERVTLRRFTFGDPPGADIRCH